MLATPTIPAILSSAVFCNSMTLNLCAWLALPAVPFVVSFFAIVLAFFSVTSVPERLFSAGAWRAFCFIVILLCQGGSVSGEFLF